MLFYGCVGVSRRFDLLALDDFSRPRAKLLLVRNRYALHKQLQHFRSTFDLSSAVFLALALVFLFIILFMVLYLCYKYVRQFPVGRESPSLPSVSNSAQRTSLKPPDERHIGTVGPKGYRFSVA